MSETMDIILNVLKAEGIDVAEDVAIRIAKGLFSAAPKIASATDNKWDDLLVPVLKVLEPSILDMLDNINPDD